MTQPKEILKKHLQPNYPGAITDEIIIASMQEYANLQTAALQEENRQLKERSRILEKALEEIKRYTFGTSYMFLLDIHQLSTKALTDYQQEQTNKTND